MKRKAISDPPPDYGSKDYWEKRYKSHQYNVVTDPKDEDGKCCYSSPSIKPLNIPKMNIVQQGTTKDIPDERKTRTGHAWYFTYKELSPLLLPLLLENNEHQIHSDCKIKVEDKDSPKILKKNILEIGCGDMPLGRDLAKEEKLILMTRTRDTVLNRIVCCDYSETVINMLKDRQEKEKLCACERNNTSEINHNTETHLKHNRLGNNSGNQNIPSHSENDVTTNEKKPCNIKDEVQYKHSNQTGNEPLLVEYIVADACDLVSFENETFHVVIDKGTLDSALSDRTCGIENCIKIVASTARVLAKNGVFVIVSHVNGKTCDGLNWLDEVVLPGLRRGANHHDGVSWFVEAHGKLTDMDMESESSLTLDNLSVECNDEEDNPSWSSSMFFDSGSFDGSSFSGFGSDGLHGGGSSLGVVSDVDSDDEEDNGKGTSQRLVTHGFCTFIREKKTSCEKRGHQRNNTGGMCANNGPTVYIIRNRTPIKVKGFSEKKSSHIVTDHDKI